MDVMSVLSLANTSLLTAAPILAHGTFLGPTQNALLEPLAVLPKDHLGYEDPSERLQLMIHGGGTASGSQSATTSRARNVITDIFLDGRRPSSPSKVEDIVHLYGVRDQLQAGKVFIWLENVRNSPLPRFHALAAMPVLHSQLFATLSNEEQWAEWMPGVVSSGSLTSHFQSPHIQELIIGTPVGRKLYTQNVMHKEYLSGGEQIYWTMRPRAEYKVPSGHTGFKTNEGSWTITRAKGQGMWTLVAYQTHFVPNMPDWGLEAFKGAIMAQVRDEFSGLMLALANRTRDPHWTPTSGTNPTQMEYTIEEFR